MKNTFKKIALAMALVIALIAGQAQAQAPVPSAEDTLWLDLKDGRVVIQMLPDLAPQHVARVKELVREGFYNGLTFHRVIPGFMAQGGDPLGNGTGGSGKKLPAEFSTEPFVRGVVGAARAGNSVNSADSQFFIMFDSQPSLNGDYTVWGKVISGMEFVDNIAPGEPPAKPDTIVKAQIAADATKDAPVAK